MLINGVDYAIEERGSGEPLLLLHGFTGSRANWWQTCAPELASQHRVITVDLLGHGETDAPLHSTRYAMKAAAEDLIGILERITEEPAHLLGYSMGGRLALYLALHHSKCFRSLTLESASPGLRTPEERAERRQRDGALADRIEREGVAAFVDFWESLSLWESQQQLDEQIRLRLRQQRLQNSALGLANSLRGMGTGVQPSLWDDLTRLTLPVLLLTGEYDHKFERINDAMAAQMPNAKRVTVSGAGHTTHLERPDAFAAAVSAHLQQA